MANVSGIGLNQVLLSSIVSNANSKSGISMAVAAKALDAQKQQGADVMQLLSSANQIKTGRIDVRV